MALMGLDRVRVGPHDGFTVLHHYRVEATMTIEARCTYCGVIEAGPYWTPVSVRASIHSCPRGRSVTVQGVMSRAEWDALHPDVKSADCFGRKVTLHLDSCGATILVPVVIR